MNTLAAKAAAKTAAKKAGNYAPPPKDNLAALTKYIPTESVTLYVAFASIQAAFSSAWTWLTPTVGYVAIAALTPVIQLWFYYMNVKGKVSWKEWPWWTMIASLVAFLVWALAVPGNPIVHTDNANEVVWAVAAAALVSAILERVGLLIEKLSRQR